MIVRPLFIIICILLLLPFQIGQAQQNQVPSNQAQIKLSFAPLVRRVAPAVVNIYTSRVVERRLSPFSDPFFDQFFGRNFNFGRQRQRVQNSLGSGVVVDAEMGYVITNYHVIMGADQIKVAFKDRREVDARVLTLDKKLDLAILKLVDPPKDLPAATLGNAEQLEVGDLVLAIGNPFGVGQTVTSGIISGLARSGIGLSDLQSFIQTDAAINPGNSGGALVSMDGEVIGINTAIFSKSGGSHGIGFAIPANLAMLMIEAARKEGDLIRPWLGMTLRPVDQALAEALNLPDVNGLLVEEIHPLSPAHHASNRQSLRVGDVLIAANTHTIASVEALNFEALLVGIGGQLPVTIYRGGNRFDVKMALIEAPKQPPPQPLVLEGNNPLVGLTLVNLSPFYAQKFNLPDQKQGVIVDKVVKGSSAERVGFKPADILLEINQEEIKNTQSVNQIVEGKILRQWQIVFERNGRKQRIQLRR